MTTPDKPRQRQRQRQKRGNPVDGMLLFDKPAGFSSNQALQQAKRLLNARKAGHTGSLDPIATGLLPLCFGETTKISNMFLTADKGYWSQFQLGVATDSGDRDGKVVRESKVDFNEETLQSALERFRGDFEQVPPMFSALKQNGKPLYKLAREGITVEREPRAVTVYELVVEKWEGDLLEVRVLCSRGFYVRTLASELGEALGCGAHVSELRRTSVGKLSIDDAVTLPQLEALDTPTERQQFLLPTDRALAHLPMVHLPDNIALYLCRGQSVRAASIPEHESGLVRVYSDSNGFLGLAEVTDDGKIAPKRMFQTA